MKTNPIVWFEIYVQDMERAKSFYEAVLAIKLEKMPAPTAECEDMEMWGFPSDKDTSPTKLWRLRYADQNGRLPLRWRWHIGILWLR